MSDWALLVCGALLLYVPGTLLLVAARVRRPQALLGMAPPVTIGLLQLAALARWGLGTGLARTAVAGIAAVAVVAAVLELRSTRTSVVAGVVRSIGTRARVSPVAAGTAVLLLAAATWLGLSSWLGGFHGLATPPQEHDTVAHTLITAYIAHTGHASPFEVMPADLVTGGNRYFYPAGAHTFAGLLAMLSGNPVSGLNATTALGIGLAGPLTLFAALTTFEPLRIRPVFSALAAVLSVTLYRPYVELAHDAGILAFAMGLALAPAIVAGLPALERREWGTPVALGVVALGLYAVHPSLAVIVVALLVVVGAVAAATWAPLRHWIGPRLPALGLTAVVSAVLTAPWLLVSTAVAGSVASYPEAPPTAPMADVLRDVVLFNYGGFIAEARLFQTGFAVLFWVGLVGCLTSRRLWSLAAAWIVWAAFTVLFATGYAGLPLVAQLGGILYNSWTRIDAVLWVLSPAVAGLGLAALVDRVGGVAWLRERRPAALAVPATALLVAVAYLLVAGLGYTEVNRRAVAERWGEPAFLRVSPIEHEAFDYLAAHRSEVGRVLNNGNDGSTFLYVYTGLPVVNTYPLGMTSQRYGIYLMQHFNELGANPAVRCLVQRYHITHVMWSVSSPRLPTFAAPDHWVTGPSFTYAPGFAGLDDVPQVQQVFANPDVRVYRIDPAVVGGDDPQSCTSDPEHPLPAGTAG